MKKSEKYTDDYFLNRGYKRFERYEIQSDIALCNFQKRFVDDVGVKYFINACKNSHEWMADRFKNSESYTSYGYTYSCQLYRKDTHAAVNMKFFSSWSIEQVEEFVERLFQNGELDYYERWDED